MRDTERLFYKVEKDLHRAPLSDYISNGFEERWLFEEALRRLLERWSNRIGEQIDERHGFVRLCFHDTPGGCPDEAWLPLYMIYPVEIPDYLKDIDDDDHDEIEEELDRIFCFY